MAKSDVYMSEKFLEFTQKVEQVRQLKMVKKAEFKKLYEQFDAEMKELDSKVAEFASEWESWKSEQEVDNN